MSEKIRVRMDKCTHQHSEWYKSMIGNTISVKQCCGIAYEVVEGEYKGCWILASDCTIIDSDKEVAPKVDEFAEGYKKGYDFANAITKIEFQIEPLDIDKALDEYANRFANEEVGMELIYGKESDSTSEQLKSRILAYVRSLEQK